MPAPVIGAVIAGGGSLYAAKRQQDAANNAADRMDQLSAPQREAQSFGLGGLKNMIVSQLMPEAGREDTVLRGKHKENVERIGKSTQDAVTQTQGFWRRSGNLGRARGDMLQIERDSTRALNEENLNYASGQREHKEASRSRLYSALTNMANLGSGGTQTAVDAERTRLAGANDFYGGIASLLGTAAGAVESNYQANKNRRLYQQIMKV